MSGDHEVRRARAALTRLAEPGHRGLWNRVNAHGPVPAVESMRVGDIPDDIADAVGARLRPDVLEQAERDLRHCARLGGRLICPEDDEWPQARLLDLTRIMRSGEPTMPPLALWARGPLPLADAVERAVAVVGARAATSYGSHVAGELCYGLAGRGWTVVSGGAYGIDGAAHRGALAAGGRTLAILASGVDVPYPRGHQALFDRIAAEGLLLSEWPPGSVPLRLRFPLRNRVIAALGRGTVVVEAAARSGARLTARRAAELGRMVMAVPGPVTSALSVGPHQLIRESDARLVTSAAEVIEEVGRIGDDLAVLPRAPHTGRDGLPPAALQVLDGLPARRTVPIDDIASAAGLDVREVMRALPTLQTAGFVEEVGQQWRLTTQARQPTGRIGAAPTVR